MDTIDGYEIKGLEIYYYYICERKLWMFSKGLGTETNSEKVLVGQLLHRFSYPRETKREVLIDGVIAIDVVKGKEIVEVKTSSKLEKASMMQVAYYLYYLESKGIKLKGELRFPKEKKRTEVILDENLRQNLKEAIENIKKIKSMEKPPKVSKIHGICRSCAYHDFCWAGEE